MARRDDLIEALDSIETGMCRVKESRDIWQNELVYALCQGVRLLMMKEIKGGQDARSKARSTTFTGIAADVSPVVRGRWGAGRFNLETGNYEEQCTCCWNFSKECGKPYCPNCGAKMDGGEHK